MTQPLDADTLRHIAMKLAREAHKVVKDSGCAYFLAFSQPKEDDNGDVNIRTYIFHNLKSSESLENFFESVNDTLTTPPEDILLESDSSGKVQ